MHHVLHVLDASGYGSLLKRCARYWKVRYCIECLYRYN